MVHGATRRLQEVGLSAQVLTIHITKGNLHIPAQVCSQVRPASMCHIPAQHEEWVSHPHHAGIGITRDDAQVH